MKKYIAIGSVVVLALVSCGRKSIPVETSTPKSNTLPQAKTDPRIGPKKDTAVVLIKPEVKEDTISAAPVAAPVATNKVMTVVDSHGRLLLDPEKTPADISPDWITLKNLRSFTPGQAQTLASRFNIVPPKVIYVPSKLYKQGRKGKYYIYSHKFWYWQKSDGLFYLDTNYYQ